MAKVTVYTTSTCQWCAKTKAFLKEHKIPFTEKDVGSDQKAAKEMVEKSGQMGVPVTIVEGYKSPIIGFSEDEFKKALSL